MLPKNQAPGRSEVLNKLLSPMIAQLKFFQDSIGNEIWSLIKNTTDTFNREINSCDYHLGDSKNPQALETPKLIPETETVTEGCTELFTLCSRNQNQGLKMSFLFPKVFTKEGLYMVQKKNSFLSQPMGT